MKKVLFLSFLLLMLVIAGCSNNDDSDQKDTAENDEQEESEESVEVDKKLLNVEVTIPASLIEADGEEQDVDEIIQEAKDAGVKEVTENDDGSLTYKMSKSTHKEMMQEMKEEMDKTINDVIEDEEFASIKDIKANKSLDEFHVIVDKEMYENSLDGLSILSLVFGSMFYQVFDGVDAGDYEAVFKFEDEETNEVFDEVVYPDAFEE